eukprot:scaffold1792_cov33-Prasinocladus_malaysianus.AAC.1
MQNALMKLSFIQRASSSSSEIEWCFMPCVDVNELAVVDVRVTRAMSTAPSTMGKISTRRVSNPWDPASFSVGV